VSVTVTKVYVAKDGETKLGVYHERRTTSGPFGEVTAAWEHTYDASDCEVDACKARAISGAVRTNGG
jgi:hypothetical protein